MSLFNRNSNLFENNISLKTGDIISFLRPVWSKDYYNGSKSKIVDYEHITGKIQKLPKKLTANAKITINYYGVPKNFEYKTILNNLQIIPNQPPKPVTYRQGVLFGIKNSEAECIRIAEAEMEAMILLMEMENNAGLNGIEIPKSLTKVVQDVRRKIINKFFRFWVKQHPEHKIYNLDLQDFIFVNRESRRETAFQASKSYRSTFAVLSLSKVLTNATVIEYTEPKKNKGQAKFEKMIIMQHENIRLLVGLHMDGRKVEYSLTAIK